MYQLGAADRWIDVEEVYLKTFELAPARLSWRTRPDIPDYKKCAKALQELEDPRRSDHLGLVDKNGAYERRLTTTGTSWCLEHADVLTALYSGGVVPSASGQGDSRKIRTVTGTDAYLSWKDTGEMTSTIWELADAFRCTGDSPASIWRARLDDHLRAAERNAHRELAEFIQEARTVVDEEVAG